MQHAITHRNIVYRLLPGSRTIASKLAGQAGACRFVWNEMLARNKAEYQTAKANGDTSPSVTFFSLGKQFTGLRQDIPWLSDYSYAMTRYALKYQADAWQKCFKEGAGVPRFKSRHRTTPSFTIPDKIRISGDRIHIPKIGRLQFRRKGGNPYRDGTPVQAVIRKLGDKWSVTICYRIEAPEIVDTGIIAGVDMNVRQVAVVTTGGTEEIIETPGTGLLDSKIARTQRRMARQKKASRRRHKTRLRLHKLQRKRAHIRKDHNHHTSKHIAGQASTVAVEALNTSGMTRSARGTIEAPGRNVKAKSGLNREILATGWHQLKQMLSYKSRVVEINPAYTSQTCHACGVANKASRTGRSFKCMACGHADHADLNAARNILASGVGASARREALATATSMSRETGAMAA